MRRSLLVGTGLVGVGMFGCAPAPGLDRVSLFQVVERPLGAPSDVPIVANREALVRLFVHTDEPHEFRASLAGMDQHVTLRASSTPDDLSSSIDFLLVPADDLELTLDGVRTTLHVLAVDVPTLEVALVPVVVRGVAPVVDAALVAELHDEVVRLYPIPDAHLAVAAPFAWNAPLGADGKGWPELLAALATTYAGPSYTYALVAPQPTYAAYCSTSCMTGLSTQATDPNDDSTRVAVGLAYGHAAVTFAHELGHLHGRHHAPCDVAQPDPSYPYLDAQIGSWGWKDGALVDPRGIDRDVMSYCEPAFISDYTYRALFEWPRTHGSPSSRVAFDHLPGGLVLDGGRYRVAP